MQKQNAINRRTFIALGATAATGFAKAQSLVVKRRIQKGEGDPLSDVVKPAGEELEAAIRTLEETAMSDEEKRAAAFPVVQREIDHMLDDLSCKDAIRENASEERVSAALAKFPVMRWYDRAFDRVAEQVAKTKVEGDKPAIWYVYNMGIVVKTKSCTFGIDVCHRKAPRLAKVLDFILTTHNHGDHYNAHLLQAMSATHKPVISNFMLVWDWYCRDMEKTFKINDVTIHCTAADHNKHLPWAVTTFEVVCGEGPDAFTIFHSGDCCRYDHLKPKGKPDVYFGHCAIGLDFMAAAQHTMPAKMFVPVHHQELGHLGGRYRCVGFEDEPLKIVRSLRKAGYKAAMPVWGDRIV